MRAPPFLPIAPRLEEKSILVPFCECRFWIGGYVPAGYGVISVNGRQTYTHRAAWIDKYGQIPDGLQVLHMCDVPACINPEHLFLGSQSENIQDMLRKGRGNYKNRARGERHHWHGGGHKGENHPGSKLSQADVNAIRSSYASGATTQVELARRYGVGQSLVSLIVRRKSWV